MDKRTVDVGRVRLSDCPELIRLRDEVRVLAERMSEAVWPSDPLATALDGKLADVGLLAVQTSGSSRLNSVWREKTRLLVKDALVEQSSRVRRHAFGCLMNLDGRIDGDDGAVWANVPRDFKIVSASVVSLAARVRELGFSAALSALTDGMDGLGDDQAALLVAVGARSRELFGRPSWRRVDSVVRLNLDARCLSGGAEALHGLLSGLTSSCRAGQWYEGRISISGVEARGAVIDLPVSLDSRRLASLALGPLAPRSLPPPKSRRDASCDQKVELPAELRFSALAVELGESEAIVKAVLSRPKVRPTLKVRCLVGRDFGYANTIALTVVRLGSSVELARLPLVRVKGRSEFHLGKDLTSDGARAYLSGHVAPSDAEVVESVLMDGSDFLGAIAVRSKRIDVLRSELDLIYARIHRLKALINRELGFDADALVPPELPLGASKELLTWHGRLFRLLGGVAVLKAKRRGVYRSIDGLKKSWFGHLSNLETRLALKHRAAVVRENLSVMAEEKSKPGYRGRAFNRMMNNGSKGQYIRRAGLKLSWNGVAEIVVPSFHTSTTDHRHGVVSKSQRDGDVFVASKDGSRWHADLHASETLALWPVLVSRVVPVGKVFGDKRILPAARPAA